MLLRLFHHNLILEWEAPTNIKLLALYKCDTLQYSYTFLHGKRNRREAPPYFNQM